MVLLLQCCGRCTTIISDTRWTIFSLDCLLLALLLRLDCRVLSPAVSVLSESFTAFFNSKCKQFGKTINGMPSFRTLQPNLMWSRTRFHNNLLIKQSRKSGFVGIVILNVSYWMMGCLLSSWTKETRIIGGLRRMIAHSTLWS